MPRQHLRLFTLTLFATAPALSAQTPTPTPTPPPTTVAAGAAHTTENSRAVTGVRIDARPDGSVWFLLPSNDRIVQLQGDSMKQWQIRGDKLLGANPVDFQVDGNFVWFIENGESQIDAGSSVFGQLDTVTGQLHEWVVPGSRPAGFYRAPDGKVWLPQTNGRLQSLDLATLTVVDYRSRRTFAYSGIVPGPDGALWMTDFGNNRIVRYPPGAATETSWSFFDPLAGRLNPSQIQFDEQGNLWISELSAARMDRFNPSTGELTSYPGFGSPIHFDLFGGRVYIAQAAGGNGRVGVLDPAFAVSFKTTLTAETLDVASSVNRSKATIRDSGITPTLFTSKADSIADADLKVSTVGPGFLQTEFPSRNGFGITVAGGAVWVGSEGKLLRLVLQTIGNPSDLTVPVAAQFGVSPGTRIEITITLYNRGTEPISGEALYLFSPGAFAPRKAFRVEPGETVLLSDAFQEASTNAALALGPVRLRVTSGAASDLVASVRTAQLREDGSSFGFAIPALSGAETLGEGASRTLFTGSRDSEASIFGLYTPEGAEATAALVASDGTVRGSRSFSLAKNIALEFNPAASAFGVAPAPGDVIRLSVSSGSLQPYVNVFDTGTTDVAVSLPQPGTRDAVIPNVGTAVGEGDTRTAADLFLSNTDTENPANLTVSFYSVGSTAAPRLATLTLPPGTSRVIPNVVSTIFAVSSGGGALLIGSDVPVAVSYRVAATQPEGDYATFAGALDGAEAIPDGGAAFAIGVPQTAARRTDLLLYNRGAAGAATVIGYNASGDEVGRLSIPIGDHQAARIDSVMAQLNAADQEAGRIRIDAAPGMRVYALTAEVDVGTGDTEIARLR